MNLIHKLLSLNNKNKRLFHKEILLKLKRKKSVILSSKIKVNFITLK